MSVIEVSYIHVELGVQVYMRGCSLHINNDMTWFTVGKSLTALKRIQNMKTKAIHLRDDNLTHTVCGIEIDWTRYTIVKHDQITCRGCLNRHVILDDDGVTHDPVDGNLVEIEITDSISVYR